MRVPAFVTSSFIGIFAFFASGAAGWVCLGSRDNQLPCRVSRQLHRLVTREFTLGRTVKHICCAKQTRVHGSEQDLPHSARTHRRPVTSHGGDSPGWWSSGIHFSMPTLYCTKCRPEAQKASGGKGAHTAHRIKLS